MLTHILLNVCRIPDLGYMATAIAALVWVLGSMLVEEVRIHDTEPRN